MSFSGDLQRFSEKTTRKLTEATQKIALDAFSEVIQRTPVKSGRAKGNWQASIGGPVSGVIEVQDPSGQYAISAAEGVTSAAEAGDVIVLANSLPYIERLESGYSAQAPAGMVALTKQRWQAIADQVIAQIARQG